MNFRPSRVGKLIREELSVILEREFEPGNALVTITEAAIGKKLDTAHIHVSVWPAAEGARIMKELETVRPRFQYLLMKKINIKPMPAIDFLLDTGPEHAAAVEKILIEAHNKEKPAE